MMALEATEYVAVRADQLTAGIRSSPGFRAFERSATVIALGGLVFGGAMLYNVVSDTSNKIAEALEDVSTGMAVSPIVFSEEGHTVLKADQLSKKFGRVRLVEFETDYQRAKQEFESTGTVRALPGTAARIKHWENVIVHKAPDLMGKEEKMVDAHPFDLAVGRLLNNRSTFFMVVGGLALVPILPVVGSIAREAIHNGKGTV